MTMREVIRVRKLSFNYNGARVLEGVNLDVNQGDFVALIGPNGSGKTTLMKLLVGQLTPSSGEISLFGTPVGRFKEWPRIGYISQVAREFNKSFPATVREVVGANLYHQMGFFKILKSEHEARIDQVLKWVDMLKFKDNTIGSLSGGQQQRILLARTLVTDPELILLDEPLVGVDARAEDEFFQLINKLNHEGITIMMVSHDIHVVSNQANKIVCLADRKLYYHNAEEFDFNYYLEEIKGKNRLVPEHRHRVVK